ncbi:hypothetical protein N008_20565 [Hymenobacter sp. APR13]|nr:hypothetical protein N008_20565 [Hymenobacter sp. APR13]
MLGAGLLAACSGGAAPDDAATGRKVSRPALPAAFSLPAPGLIAEGLAYDPAGHALYVSTVRGQTIYRLPANGTLRRFSRPADSLSGVFGLAIDTVRGYLWAATGPVPHLARPGAAAPGVALVRYPLAGGPPRRFPVPADGRPHLLGDVLPAPDGTVYATDSRTPVLYRLRPGQLHPEPWLNDSLFYSLQGLALLPGARTLLLADYHRGVLAVELATGRVRALTPPPTDKLRGLDGLCHIGPTTLLATRNGTAPNRLLRVTLDTVAGAVRAATPLSTGPLPDLTLGTVAAGRFYYIGRSGWAEFDEQGRPLPGVAPAPARVGSILLPAR